MTNMRKYAGSSFISLDDIRAGPIQATIVKVTPEGSFGKPVLLLDSGRQFSLNATNTKTLIAAFGDDDADWIEMRIQLSVGFIKYRGEEQESVLIKAISPGKPVAERTPSKPLGNDLNDEIPF